MNKVLLSCAQVIPKLSDLGAISGTTANLKLLQILPYMANPVVVFRSCDRHGIYSLMIHQGRDLAADVKHSSLFTYT